ncbi:hypothetical protein [Pedobacter jeongneungensis]|uniref:hypothetical protein n=1 Tax=Pedobacter jeongneungensis TaxID=947309 RepID=UPI000468C66E|nr:hypothetical protein [Pedobacter jeongneungensis]
MKKPNLIERAVQVLKIVNLFFTGHLAALNSIKKETVYVSRGLEPSSGVRTLKITKEGSLYRVTLSGYLHEDPFVEATWLATYGWHSNGHLIEIGGNRYCIFDSLRKKIFVEQEMSYGYRVEEFDEQ